MANTYTQRIAGRPLSGILLLCVFAFFLPAQALAQLKDPLDSHVYLLVIDHSGSMSQLTDSGKSRWREMQDKAIKFIEKRPLESEIWLAVFATEKARPERHRLLNELDREVLINRIRKGYGNPQGATALYDTLGMAFEQAERLSNENPGRKISVMAYTDGLDHGSREWNPAKLKQRFRQLVNKNNNIWMFYTTIGDDAISGDRLLGDNHVVSGDNDDFLKTEILSLSLSPSSVVLQNPVVNPKQTFQFELTGGTAADWKVLAGKKLTIEYIPAKDAAGKVIPDQNIKLHVPDVTLKQGPMPVTVEALDKGALQAQKEYRGALRITYPKLDKYDLQVGNEIAVTFLKEAKLEIYDRFPADGTTFPARKPVRFLVRTLEGAKVVWQFGDEIRTGANTTFTYNTPGEKNVRVSVEGDPRVGKTSQEFSINILDIGVTLDPFTGIVVEGVPFTFSATGRGDIKRFVWNIDGGDYEGRPPQDASQNGSRITYVFNRPGKIDLKVYGEAETTTVSTSDHAVEVLSRPSIQVVGGTPASFSKPVALKLDSPPGWKSVNWDFGDGETEAGKNPQPVHQYAATGTYLPKATVTWEDGTELPPAEGSVTVVAEPIVAQPVAKVGGREVSEFTIGSTVSLVDDSKGDVIQREWYHNGTKLPQDQASLPIETGGEHRLKLVLYGPADRSGQRPPPVEKELVLVAREAFDWFLFLSGCLLGVVAMGLCGRLFFGNAPMYWEVYYGNRKGDFDGRVKISKYWSLWKKKAVVPMSRFFSRAVSDYWGSGEGAKEHVQLVVFKSGNNWEGSLEFSGEGNRMVRTAPPQEDGRKIDYQWTDRRCPEEEFQTLYFRLEKKQQDFFWPVASLAAAVVVIGGTLWLIYEWAARGGL